MYCPREEVDECLPGESILLRALQSTIDMLVWKTILLFVYNDINY
jgi:hypothetical protein